jgi:hypothetical protein
MQNTTQCTTCAICGGKVTEREHLNSVSDVHVRTVCENCADRWRRDVESPW